MVRCFLLLSIRLFAPMTPLAITAMILAALAFEFVLVVRQPYHALTSLREYGTVVADRKLRAVGTIAGISGVKWSRQWVGTTGVQ